MFDKFFSFSEDTKKEIIEKIKNILIQEEYIVFAYIFGSFLNDPSFRDIDIGIFVDNINLDEDFEVKLIDKISKSINLPFEIIDLRIINKAKHSFLNNIFRTGLLLFTKNEKLLTDLIEETSLEAIANEYISQLSLKELLSL